MRHRIESLHSVLSIGTIFVEHQTVSIWRVAECIQGNSIYVLASLLFYAVTVSYMMGVGTFAGFNLLKSFSLQQKVARY